MAQRRRAAGRAFDESLLAEVLPLQRRLGLLIDLATAESMTQTTAVGVTA
jgi:hypothetical protein